MENSLTEGIRQLLYGHFKPGPVADRFNRQDSGLCHDLRRMPASPKNYLQMDPDLEGRWNHGGLKGDRWLPAYYSLPPDKPEAFHILCTFYRVLIRCECRMMVQAAEGWVEDQTLSILKYELVSLRGHLLEHLKECEGRLNRKPSGPDSLPGRLERFMLQLLRNHLLMVFYELQQRYEHLLEDQLISTEELYLEHLQRPVPRQEDFCPTIEFTRDKLEKCLRPPVKTRKIRQLMDSIRKRFEGEKHPEMAYQLRKNLHLLENTWLCMMICRAEEKADYSDLNRPETCLNRIQAWRKIVAGSDEDAADLHLLLKQMPDIYPVLKNLPDLKDVTPLAQAAGAPFEAGQHYSAAAMLIAEIEHLFDPAAGSGGLTEDSESKNDHNDHPLLEQYISFDEIRKKFGVSDKTLKNYLQQSNATLTVFSNKSKWMRRDHFESFVASFQQNM